jgi:hypothetical protein
MSADTERVSPKLNLAFIPPSLARYTSDMWHCGSERPVSCPKGASALVFKVEASSFLILPSKSMHISRDWREDVKRAT